MQTLFSRVGAGLNLPIWMRLAGESLAMTAAVSIQSRSSRYHQIVMMLWVWWSVPVFLPEALTNDGHFSQEGFACLLREDVQW